MKYSHLLVILVSLFTVSLYADGPSRCKSQSSEFVFQATTSTGKQDYTYTLCEIETEWGQAYNTDLVIRTDSSDPDDLSNAVYFQVLPVGIRSENHQYVLVPKDSTGFTVEDVVTLQLIPNKKAKKMTARISTVAEMACDEFVEAQEK